MVFCVTLGGFCCMVGRMVVVALGGVSVVSRSLMVTSFVMPRRFMMMPGSVFQMMCRVAMVFYCFFGHRVSFRRFLSPKDIALFWLSWHEEFVKLRRPCQSSKLHPFSRWMTITSHDPVGPNCINRRLACGPRQSLAGGGRI